VEAFIVEAFIVEAFIVEAFIVEALAKPASFPCFRHDCAVQSHLVVIMLSDEAAKVQLARAWAEKGTWLGVPSRPIPAQRNSI